MSIKKSIWMFSITGISFVLAIQLHHYANPTFEFPPLLSKVSATTLEGKAFKNNTLLLTESINISGLSQQINFLDKTLMQMKIESFWNNFYHDEKLQNSVKWSSPTLIYALYDGFNDGFNDGTANLTIGYRDSQYRKTPAHLVTQLIPKGKYKSIEVPGSELAALTDAWNDISFSTVPFAVLEIYELDEQGKITNIQLKVMY